MAIAIQPRLRIFPLALKPDRAEGGIWNDLGVIPSESVRGSYSV